MQVLFTFTFNTETKQGTFTGNIPADAALGILQGLVVADKVAREKEKQDKPPDES